MNPRLSDMRQLVRFASVSVLGTVADYVLSVFLVHAFQFGYLIASTLGFSLGAFINYCGHNIFSYRHTSRKTISVRGFRRYFLAVIFSLVARLLVVYLLSLWTELPFWLIQLVAIGASFATSYIISTLWAFALPQDKHDQPA